MYAGQTHATHTEIVHDTPKLPIAYLVTSTHTERMTFTPNQEATASVCVAILVVTAILRVVYIDSRLLVLLAAIAWVALSIPAALVLGRAIRRNTTDNN